MIVAANLKTNLTRKETSEYVVSLEEYMQKTDATAEVLVFPATSSLLASSQHVTIGAQNAYPVKSGAFTGEIGLVHLEEFALQTILIGHSERRHVFGETQEEIVKKFNYFKDLGFKIVYCIGESLSKREAGEKEMMEYISSQYDGIDTEYENLIIAYEPVWAIGTGVIPTLEDIETMHTLLKEKSPAPLLYGGSVKVTNEKEVLALNNVDGVLVGSASLDVKNFCSMIGVAQAL